MLNTITIEMLAVRYAALKTAGVKFILPQFTDIHGVAKGKLIPIDQWQSLYTIGAGFAGPSIWGTGLGRTGHSSEYYARADENSAVQQLPWQPEVARVVCDGYVAGKPFAADPRQVLKAQIKKLAELGFVCNVGIEPEFFILSTADSTKTAGSQTVGSLNVGLGINDTQDTLEKPSYDLNALFKSPVYPLISQLHDTLLALDFDVVQLDHEDAPGQYEINYTYDHALAAADRFMLFKLAAHGVAAQHGQAISFMPKPFADRPGSGLHFHLSLSTLDGKDVCAGEQGELLSATALSALGGLLKHAPALTAIHAPTVNSYKRLVIGRSLSGTTWAPAHIAYGFNNRTCVARTLAGRFEWRLPDPSCNVYLALAGVIAAMIDGLENQLNPAKMGVNSTTGLHRDDDLYECTAADLEKAGIHHLPQNLGEAIAALETDTALVAAIGVDVMAQFIELKRMEWIDYSRHVSDWEIAQYARKF